MVWFECAFPRALCCAATAGLAALALQGCSTPRAADSATVHTVTPLLLRTGPPTGVYAPLGRALADIYNAKLPDVHVTATGSTGPEGAAGNPQALENGQADLAFSRADFAYQVYRQSSGDSEAAASTSHLRSIAVMYTNAVHFVVRRASGITRGEDIRGHRLTMAEESTVLSRVLARDVTEAYGIDERDVQVVTSARDWFVRLRAGELDARIFASAYPNPGIEDVGPSSPLALLPLDPRVIARLRSQSPFYKPAVMPKGTYKGQTEDIPTVGIDGLLLCRDVVPEDVVYALTKALFDALPDLARTQTAAGLIDVVNAPATPVPLHPGAARYYRERDLFR